MSSVKSEEFFWFRTDEDEGCVYIGITQQGLEYCGAIQSVDIQFQQDEVFSEGDTLFALEGNHNGLEYVAQKSGKISSINLLSQEEPEAVNEDPLEEGWIISIEKAV